MEKTVRFAVSLDHHLLDDFDRVLVSKKYATRSEAVRDLIRDHLVAEDWDAKRETVGTITIVFDHHIRDLTEKLTRDRKSTRLNSSHSQISYAVFCLKKKKKKQH